MNDKPRILIVENSQAVTGALNSVMRSAEMLAAHFQFIFLLPSNSTAILEVRRAGFEVCDLPMKEIRKDIWSLVIYFPLLLVNTFRLSNMARTARIDLIVSNDFYNMLPTAYKFLGGRVHYLCYVRFLPSKFPNILVSIWCWLHYRYAESIIAVSGAVKKELPLSRKIKVINNEFPNLSIDFETPYSDVILYPANFIEGKGQESALRVFAMVHRSHPQWKLRFVGGDMGLRKNKRFKEKLIADALRLRLQDSVEWSDFSNQIGLEYLRASIVLNFSESESFSLTCLEAMFYGRPIIATRSGGPQEIIDHGKTGLLVNVGDERAMADALEKLIVTPQIRASLARDAYDSIRIRFDVEKTKQLLFDAYADAMK